MSAPSPVPSINWNLRRLKDINDFNEGMRRTRNYQELDLSNVQIDCPTISDEACATLVTLCKISGIVLFGGLNVVALGVFIYAVVQPFDPKLIQTGLGLMMLTAAIWTPIVIFCIWFKCLKPAAQAHGEKQHLIA